MRKSRLYIIIVLSIIGVPAGLFFSYIVLPGLLMGHEVRQLRTRLLCKTDHQALLNACRELSRKLVTGEVAADVYKGSDILKLPDPIPSLQPNHVTLGEDGQVKIEMFVGWYPLGVQVYPEGFPNYPPPFKYGDRQLLPGLWYYDDGYSSNPDEYDKRIDHILEKCGRLKVREKTGTPRMERR
jgi:hypothetical protein